MKRLSLKSSTVYSLIVIGLLFVVLSWMAGNYFRQAALDAQTQSLSRIIEVASREVLRKLQRTAMSMGAALNQNAEINRAIRDARRSHNTSALVSLLDDPFITGFVGANETELAKIRVYDINLRPLEESSRGLYGLPFVMPTVLEQQARTRKGVERLKALSGLWLSAHQPLYSVLLPVGGLHIDGYVELVFDPRFTLRKINEITGMPVTILLPDEPYPLSEIENSGQNFLAIEYHLLADDGDVAYRMVGLEDINKLRQDMLYTQWLTVIGFLTLIFLVLLAALWFLRKGLFMPLSDLMHGIEHYSQGNLDVTICPSGLREPYSLGVTFNEMLQRIRDDILELERHSTADGLTGIPNRRYFDTTMERELSFARRQKLPLALLYIDIDYFKNYNDHYGHQAGDETLKQVARAISEMARRDTDTAARLGGEEFGLLLQGTDVAHAQHIAEMLRQRIRQLAIPHVKSLINDHITLSIGVVSMVPGNDTVAEDIIGRADRALYHAKHNGRDRVSVADPEQRPV